MRLPLRLAAVPLAVALAVPLLAGECVEPAQVCLDHLVTMRDRGYAGVDIDARGDDGEMTVTKVYVDTPARKAGVRVGDVLVSIGGLRLGDEKAMQQLDDLMKPGNTVDFTVIRDGKSRTFSLTLVRMPDDVFARFVGEHMMLHARVDPPPAN